MERRNFLKTAAAGGIGMLASRNVLAENNFGPTPIELEETTVIALQSAMASGGETARSIAQGYLTRIDDIDKKLNSVIERNPDALMIADRMDRERKAGKIRGPLHGIPVLIKDNIETADTMKTTAGSLALVDAPTPKNDAFVVGQLRDAGAVILGKTNL